ncbi:MAG: asparaginase [Planctomycetota bacterium]|nr:asparaginase [Planctomycetota bacterium]
MDAFVPLTEVYRGKHVESVHRGAYVLLRGEQVVESGGDLDQLVFYRSASKALQTLVVVTSGAADQYGFDAAALAIAAGSHSGVPEHVEVVERMLASAGLEASQLQCGAHWPFDVEARQAARREHDKPLVVHSNCSGKHAAMLAAAKAMGASLEDYCDPEHPVQQEIRGHIAAFAGVAVDEVAVLIDGCSAPTFAVSLIAGARSLQRLGVPNGLPEPLADAARRVTAAALRHPEMIGGPGRFDTELMVRTTERLMAKAGAEGVHATVLPERNAVLYVKVEDGSDRGYRRFVLDTLKRHGYMTEAEAALIEPGLCPRVLTNHAGVEVGHVEVVART